MKPLHPLLFFFLLCLCTAVAQEVREPRPKIELGDVTLSDGRILKNARLLGATDQTINVAHTSGIEQIPRNQFSQEFIDLHQTELGKLRKEYDAESSLRANQASLAKQKADEEKRRQRRAIAEAKRLEQIARAENDKHNAELDRERREEEKWQAHLAAQRAAELAQARDGVLLTHYNISGDTTMVTVRNVHENPRRLEWRELRGRTADGRFFAPVNCVSTDKNDRSWDLRSGQTRTFYLHWSGEDNFAVLTWAEGGQELAKWQPAVKTEDGPIPTAPTISKKVTTY